MRSGGLCFLLVLFLEGRLGGLVEGEVVVEPLSCGLGWSRSRWSLVSLLRGDPWGLASVLLGVAGLGFLGTVTVSSQALMDLAALAFLICFEASETTFTTVWYLAISAADTA